MSADTQQLQPRLVRSALEVLGSTAVSLYSTTKNVSPTLKLGIDCLEQKFEPYRAPVVAKWMEHGDAVVTLLDTKVADTVSKVKPHYDEVAIPTETYLRTSVNLAQEKVAATEQYLRASKNTLVEKVNEQVLKPYQDKVVAPTGAYLKGLKENVVTYSIQSTGQATETISTFLEKADTVIDRVLPEEAEEPVVTGSSSCSRGLRQSTSTLTKKVASRLSKRAFRVAQYSTARTQEIVHIDLIAYARETFGADESKIAAVFDRVIGALPSADSSKKFANSLTQSTPASIRPYVQRGADVATPALNYGVDSLTFILNACRRKLVVLTQIPQIPSLVPLAIENRLALNDTTAEQPHTEPLKLVEQPKPIETETSQQNPSLIEAVQHNTDDEVACKEAHMPVCHDACLPSCSSPVLEPASPQENAHVSKKRNTKKPKATDAQVQ
eukprot:c9914_g1_i1.p1 GENE.c9914_g1_i1~~c9914_g1_i1.p1  ORF type:complete len:455 (+),score=111.18 c9914_g1_i1:47-1366(+)